MAKVGVLGSGQVGAVLAEGFLKYGHQVMRGSRDPAKLQEWAVSTGGKAKVGTFQETAQFGEIVVLATKGSATEAVVELCREGLARKTVIDTTNPIADAPPENGVLRYFTNHDESLMERLQKKVPAANFVKAFSSVGNAMMVNPDYGAIRPTMFICGNDDGAKKAVAQALDDFGWDVEDLGTVEAARAIEPLCMLWCIPGFRQNRWRHAFKLLENG